MARKKEYGRKPWVFTLKRRQSLSKAQRIHQELVELGKRARARGMK